MTEAWWLAIFYTCASLGGGLGIFYGWREHIRADAATAEIDIAYLEGFDDGQADRVIVRPSDWPERDGWRLEYAPTQLELPGLYAAERWQEHAAQLEERGGYDPPGLEEHDHDGPDPCLVCVSQIGAIVYPELGLMPGPENGGRVVADAMDSDLAAATVWLEQLRAPAAGDPPTDEWVASYLARTTETDTGWMRRVGEEAAEAWDGSTERIAELTEIYYRKMGGGQDGSEPHV